METPNLSPVTVLQLSSEDVRSWRMPELAVDWARVWQACPWASYGQAPTFCRLWYETFTEWSPLVIVGKHGGETVGIAALAWQPRTRVLIFAGAERAEYKSCIALPEYAAQFVPQVLRLLVTKVPFRRLECLFLPSNFPMACLAADRFCRTRTYVRPIPKPILTLDDPGAIDAALKKSRNKSNLNHLRKLGNLTLRRVLSPADVEHVSQALRVFSGIRIEALYGFRPPEDPRQAEFLGRLVKETDIPHVSGLFADDRLVAGHIGYRTRDELALGTVGHDPRLDAHSPGKLQILLLARQLAAEGIKAFDLTPGGNYKERLATHYETAYIANFFRRRLSRDVFVLVRRFFAVARWIAARKGRTPDQVRLGTLDLRARLALLTPARALAALVRFFRRLRQWVASDREMRIYSILPSEVVTTDVEHIAEAGRLQDLLAYDAEEAWLTRRRFLADCLLSLAGGSVPYTHVEDGRLTHFGWLDFPGRRRVVELLSQPCVMPANGVVLSNFYTVPSARGRGLLSRSLRQILAEASQLPGVEEIAAWVEADNWASRKIVERLNFQWRFSLHERRRLWMVKRWRGPGSFVTSVVPDDVVGPEEQPL